MQITGLLSFYYLSIGHINRAWVLIGMGLRFGYALGLHIRNEDRTTSSSRKEELARIWWGHSVLDRHLAAITGRPGVGIHKICSIPLPLPLPSSEIEDSIIESRYGDRITTSASSTRSQSVNSKTTTPHYPDTASTSYLSGTSQDPANSGSYLRGHVCLTEITEEALNLYRADTIGKSWQTTQDTVGRLAESLDVWLTTLPHDLRLSSNEAERNNHFSRERTILEILYHSTRILITRPCLCRLDRRIQNQTAWSDQFNQNMALVCVDSAKSLTGLLPGVSELNIHSLYAAGPWWSMVHTIMQSIAVLLLEVSYHAGEFPEDRQEVLPPLKKLIRWLRTMRTRNKMAARAYGTVMDLLRKLNKTIAMNIPDLFQEDDEIKAAATMTSISTPPHVTRPDGGSLRFTAQAQYHGISDHELHTSHSYSDPMIGGHYTSSQPQMHGVIGTVPSDASTNLHADSWDVSGSYFSNLFLTYFDEQNPLPTVDIYDTDSSDDATHEILPSN